LKKHLATFCLASPKYTLTDCVRYKPGNTSAVNFVVSFAVDQSTSQYSLIQYD